MMGMANGGLPTGIAEVKTGTYYAESNIITTHTFSHGCNGAPNIIVLWSDYKTVYTPDAHPSNTTVVAAHYDMSGGSKSYASVPNTYSGTTDATSGTRSPISNTDSGNISNVNSSTFDILCVSNRRLGAGLTYKWVAIRLS